MNFCPPINIKRQNENVDKDVFFLSIVTGSLILEHYADVNDNT